MIRRVTLVSNPGSRRAARMLPLVRRIFAANGVDCTVCLTEAPGHAADIARAAGATSDAVFTLGGDGTVMEVVGALAGTDTPVGIIPGGTGNLIARSLGIPLRADLAVTALLAGGRLRADLGRLADGRHFAFTAGIGIDAEMIERTSVVWKRRIGVLAYALTAARAAIMRENFRARVTVDGIAHERDASVVMVANFGAVLNELITLGPDIVHDDGVLDVCIFSPVTVTDALRVMWRLLHRDFAGDPCMWYGAGREIRIETDPVRMAQADGELIGPTPLVISVVPAAATLLVPARR